MASSSFSNIKFFNDQVYLTLSPLYLEEALYALNSIARLAKGDLFAIDELFLDQRFLLSSNSTKAPSSDIPVAYSKWEYSPTKSLLMLWRDECLFPEDKKETDRITVLESAIAKLQSNVVHRIKPKQTYIDNWNVRNPSVFFFQKNVEGDYSWATKIETPLSFETKTSTDITSMIPKLSIKNAHEITLTVPEAYAVQSALESYFRLLLGQWSHLEHIQHFTNISWTWDHDQYRELEKSLSQDVLFGKNLVGVRSLACKNVHLMYDYLRYVLSYNQEHKQSRMYVSYDEPNWDDLNKNMRCQAGSIESLLSSLRPNQGLGMIKSSNIYGHNTVNVMNLHDKPSATKTAYIMSKCLYEVRMDNIPEPVASQEKSISMGS